MCVMLIYACTGTYYYARTKQIWSRSINYLTIGTVLSGDTCLTPLICQDVNVLIHIY